MSRRGRGIRAAVTVGVAFAAVLLGALPVFGSVPQLMERAVLPYTPDVPTSACAVSLADGEQLVVGLAGGQLVAFHGSAGGVFERTIQLPGTGAIDAMVACYTPRPARGNTDYVILALRGRELMSIDYDELRVTDRVAVPAPSGEYRLTKAAAVAGRGNGAEQAVLHDDYSAALVTVAVPSLAVSVEWQHADPERAVARSAGWMSWEFAPGDSAATAIAFSDTLSMVGGFRPLTSRHDVGWVSLVAPGGRVIATTDHASPVTNIARIDDLIAVQGGGRNLSVYDLSLNLVWDHDSPVDDVTLLAGNFAGDESTDLAVVGTRTYQLGSTMVDSIRSYLADPNFMKDAVEDSGIHTLRRAFITFYVSNVGVLESALTEGTRGALDAFDSGDVEAALALATEARGAAAVLGRRDEVAELTEQIAGYVSFPKRRSSLFLASLVLLALGAWTAARYLRGGVSVRASAVAALLLFVTAAVAWWMLGDTGMNFLLLGGGALAVVCAVQAKLRPDTVRRKVSGATIEELIRVLMEFLHGGGEGVPSEGVVDAARKSMTKVAYLAQEMSDSMGDAERYEMLRERFHSRGEDFLDTTYPRVVLLLSLARRTGFIVDEVERMARAGDRMRDAVAAALQMPPPEPPVMKQQLRALAEARETLAAAADRGWAVVQTDPGCSLTRSIDRILREREDELEGIGCRVALTRGVPAEQDAIAIWSFELRFILENLVTNALRAMEDSRERVLSIETTTDGRTCSIKVGDTGAGMSEETAARLFEARDDERDGGFGLPNARMRLREAGGDLVVERTAPGEGTMFLMTIPHWTPNTGDA